MHFADAPGSLFPEHIMAKRSPLATPLLFTLASANFAMTLLIFTDAQQPETSLQQVAWATALVLLGAVLALSAFARFIAWWLTRRAR